MCRVASDIASPDCNYINHTVATIKILAISRAGAFSPNHIGNDAAILHGVTEQLRRRGCKVVQCNEEQFLNDPEIEADIILNMCRQPESLDKLRRLEDAGALVINSGYAIANCTRERMTLLLLSNGIPYPPSLMVDTNSDAREELERGGYERCWVKRGEFHAQHKEDVTYCRHIEETQGVLHEFFYRGIKRAVINKHLDGDLVKFYGLRDGSFFYWFYPLEENHSKFGDELVNGQSHHYYFDEERLKEICIKAAAITGVDIYGGDVIVSREGEMSIIDFNDWPSFAPCREEASPVIAKYVLNRIRTRMKEKTGHPVTRRTGNTRKTGSRSKKDSEI